ncbi:hypothetical protein NGRA_2668 [Nosema granulosis]|uniref:USP domain-containing protein n=1 Tax=Nosema granulosis TaxID=83296 RepID=A0A9P6KXX3_9MICR|nr:hypothetical protein NGRA_2668 [Nosema granulosis]
MNNHLFIISKFALILLFLFLLVWIMWFLKVNKTEKSNTNVKNRNGIRNRGTNCYASSVFQCINNLDILRSFFLTLSDSNKRASNEIKTILKKLNTPSEHPIDIYDNLNRFLDMDGNNEILKKNQMNDVRELYDAIMSSSIKEECGNQFARSIFHTNEFFYCINVNDSFLIKNCLVHRNKNNTNINAENEIVCDYIPYIDLDYFENVSFEALIQRAFFKKYHLLSNSNKILVLSFENNVLRSTDMIVQEKLNFNGKTYNLKSLCINQNGNNGHYIARVIVNDQMITYNDTLVTSTKINYKQRQGNVRLAFYEISQ